MYRIYAICCLAIMLSGCVGTTDTKAPELESIQSALLTVKASSEVKRSVYVALHDNNGPADRVREQLQQQLRARDYTIAEVPSAAGYIFHVRLLHAGAADSLEVRRSVERGYGERCSTGEGTDYALVADLLLASRLTPRAPHSKSEVLRHSSVRTMQDRYSLRMAILQKGCASGTIPVQQAIDMLATKAAQLLP